MNEHGIDFLNTHCPEGHETEFAHRTEYCSVCGWMIELIEPNCSPQGQKGRAMMVDPKKMFLSAREALDYQYKHPEHDLWHFSGDDDMPTYWVCSTENLKGLGGTVAKPAMA